MERKIRLMKLVSLVALFLSIAVAFAMSDMAVLLKWSCAAVMVLATIAIFLKKENMQNGDEREMYIEHVAGWVSGILTLVVINWFIISDVLKNGNFDHRLFSLISIWAVSRVVVVFAMGGGRGTIAK